MTIREKFYFIGQVRDAFDKIGAVIPTSCYAASAMASECARRIGPKSVLEVGAGTGSITAEIVNHIGPEDRLVVCEIIPEFMAYLRRRFEEEPAFQRVRNQVTFYEGSVTDIEGSQQFDCIISAVPFTSFPVELTRAILERYRELLKPGGTLTYIEYAYLRSLKHVLASEEQRKRTEEVNRLLDHTIGACQYRRDMVWRNVPPAWIRHLRLGEAQPHDALLLAPLEHSRRLAGGVLPISDEAVPFMMGLGVLALLLRRVARRVWALPLVLAGLVAWFLRDPVRRVEQNTDNIYAASDGRVLSVERVQEPCLGSEEWLRIAVFLSLANVHINRMPVAGKVVQLFQQVGGYAAAYGDHAEHNNACYTVIEGVRGPCVVVQRAGMVARRMVNWSRVGHVLAQGERFGLIRFGSRTDVYLPASRVQACVAPGDTVQAGQTVIACYTDDTPR